MTPSGSDRRLRILHVSGRGEWRGRTMQALALVERLAAKGHAPALAAPRSSPLAARAASRGVQPIPVPRGGLGRLIALRRLVGGQAWDAIHLHDVEALKAVARGALGIAAPAFVLSVPGDVGYHDRALPRGTPIGRVAQFWAASEWVWSALVRSGIDESRIAVIHTGVDLDRFSRPAGSGPAARQAARAALGIPDGDLVIGTVARLTPAAGLDHLIEAGRMIRSGESPPGEPRARLLVVGDGPHRIAIERAASRAGMSEAVVFGGWSEDVPGMLAAMDIYVHPAVAGGGFPVSLREAMAAGVPVVASDLMGIREILDNGRQGLIVPPGDAAALALNIMRLRRDAAFARQIGHAGSLKVQRYGLKAMADRAEALYFRLVR